MDLNQIIELYSSNLKQFGLTSKSVGWSLEKDQLLRFNKLLSVIENKDKPIIVNDLGCGYGAQFKYMIKNGYKIKTYYGYDISSDMIDAALKFNVDKKAVFLVSNKITRIADYSFSSGIFNVKFNEKNESWRKYVLKTLNNLNEFSKRGFSFNLLSTFVDYREQHLYYGNPTFYFNYCKKHFSRNVALLHDYGLFEWTIIVKKNF